MMECAVIIVAVLLIILVATAVVVGLRILLGWGIAEAIDWIMRK